MRGENPFERTEIDRAKRRYDEPEAKKSKIAMPAYMERVQEDGVRLTEEELEERIQELLAKAEIQAGEAEELDDSNARKILSVFEKRLRKIKN